MAEINEIQVGQDVFTIGGSGDFPIYFDESGTVRQIGWYKNSAGLKKPVYEQNVKLQTAISLASNTWVDISAKGSMENLLYASALTISGATNTYVYFSVFGNFSATHLRFLQTRNNAMEVFAYTIQFTKTTDSWE